jgi:hypothetical protein
MWRHLVSKVFSIFLANTSGSVLCSSHIIKKHITLYHITRNVKNRAIHNYKDESSVSEKWPCSGFKNKFKWKHQTNKTKHKDTHDMYNIKKLWNSKRKITCKANQISSSIRNKVVICFPTTLRSHHTYLTWILSKETQQHFCETRTERKCWSIRAEIWTHHPSPPHRRDRHY